MAEEEMEHEMEMEATKGLAPPPPAYGLWRGSVVSLLSSSFVGLCRGCWLMLLCDYQRVDPNLLHWRRIESENGAPPLPPQRPRSDASIATVRRPPSYTPPMGHTGDGNGSYF